MKNKGIIAIINFFLFFIMIEYRNCQYASNLSPDLQFKTMDLNISDEDFEGKENIDYGVSFGLLSRYTPLSSIIQVGNIGIFESNCFHYLNVAEKETKRINMIYYDCFDYEKRIIRKKVEFIDDQNKFHIFEIDIKSDEYENEWLTFLIIILPQQNKFKILLMNQKSAILKEERSIKYPFYDKKLTITFGGGLEAYYNNSIIKYSYFPGQLQLYLYYITLYYHFDDYSKLDLEYLQAESKIMLLYLSTLLCRNNQVNQIIKSYKFFQVDKLFQNSEFSNQDYFQLIGWIRILQVINPKNDQSFKVIKMSVNSQDDRLTNDDLSPFQFYYKISENRNSIIFTTYSYTFPTVNLNAINERYLITYEFRLYNNIQNWHYLSVTLKEKQLLVSIEFYEGLLSQIYTKMIQVNQFSVVNFQLQFGNILKSKDSYLNIEMSLIQFSNCDSISLQKCYDESCSNCIGPTNADCQSCLQNTKRVYLPETQQCVCPIDTIDQGDCLNIKDVNLSVVEQINNQFQCPYGYFTVDQECFLCPSIISDSQITCLECLNNPLIWHTMMYCSSQLVSYNGDTYTYETFQNMYYIFDGIDIQYCNYCTDICPQDCINTHFQIINSQNQVQCSFKSAFDHQHCFQCDVLYCLTCRFSIQKGKYCIACKAPKRLENGRCIQSYFGEPEFCFDNCTYCYLQICYQCSPPFYLASDKKSCKKCPIQNCRFCFEYKTNDRTKNTISKDFEIFEVDEYFSIGCSLCNDGYNYDFSLNQCIKGFPTLLNCIQSYVESYGEEKCLLSAIDDFSIAPEIINCDEHIINCDQCVITPSKILKCIICKPGYSSQLETGLCDLCEIDYSLVCLQQDYRLKDYWVQLMQSFIIQFFSKTYYYPQPFSYLISDYPLSCIDGYNPTSKGFCAQYCDEKCLSCIQNVQNYFYCKQCPKNQYGYQSLSNDGQNCLECSKFCISCLIRSDEEIKRVNPQFIVTSANIKSTYICLRPIKDYRIKLDQNTQIAYYCLDQNCSRSLEKQILIEGLSLDNDYTIDPDFCNQMGITDYYLTLSFLARPFKINNQYTLVVYNRLKQKIFSLQTTILKFKGTEFRIHQNNLVINDFDIIIFEDIIYYLSLGGDQFNFSNINKSISLFIKNTKFWSESNSLTNFQIKTSLYKDVTLNNVTFVWMNFQNVIWMEYTPDLDENVVEITHLRIENCTFENTTLISFIKYSKSIHIQTIEISNSYFFQSTFLQFNVTNLQIGSRIIFINNLKISNCTFNFSTFIVSGGEQNIQIDYINISRNSFENSVFMNSNFQTTLRNVVIKENEFLSSTFFLSSTQSGSALFFEFFFQQFRINENVFIQSKLFLIQDQNENKIQVYAEDFMQNDQLQNQIQSKIENLTSQYHLYDFQCYQLSINNFNFQNTLSFAYFKIYQTNRILLTNIIFSNPVQIHKISAYNACTLPILNSPVLLEIYGFAKINLQKISISNQFSIDSSLIQIQSDFQQKSTDAEMIKIEEITFKSNIILKFNLANLFSILVIYSQRIQNIYIKDITFQENNFHQIIDDPSQVSAGLIYLNSFQSSVEVEGITCQDNSMTNSSFSFIAFNSLTISFNNFKVHNHNLLSTQIWQKYYQIELDSTYTTQVVHSLIDQFFAIKTIGGVLQVVSSQLKISNASFSNILAQSSVALAIQTQGKGIIQIVDIQIQKAFVMLFQTNTIDGCITISSVTSLLNLKLQNINFDYVQNRFGSAILTIDPSYKQNTIILMNITINNSFSLFNQIMKIQFSLVQAESNQVFIKDINFLQSQDEFEKYLKAINFPSIAEVRKIKGESSIINLQGCRLTINNLFATGILISPFLIVSDAQRIIIDNLNFQKIQVLYPCKLLQFTFTQTNFQNIIVENLIFQKVSQVNLVENLNTQITLEYQFSDKINECMLSPQILKTKQVNQTINSFLDIFFQVVDVQGLLIFIGGLTQQSNVQLRQIDLRNNNCSFCYNGLIQIYQLIPAQIKINQLLCTKNLIFKQGCLSLLTEQVSNSFEQKYIISNSKFLNNFGEMGVGVFVSNTPFCIKNSIFYKNNGSEKGGAIFISDMISYSLLNNTIIIENNAMFGGGMYLEGANSLSENNFVKSLVLFNKAQVLSNNLVEGPNHLILQINNQEMSTIIKNQIDGKLYILNLKPYKFIEQGKIIMTSYLFVPSNQKILHYERFNEKTQILESYISQFSFVFKNSLNEIIGGEEKDSCQLFTREVQENVQEQNETSYLTQNFSFQIDKNNFDLSGITIKSDPYKNQDRFIELLFKCESTSGQKVLHYQINAKTFKCQLGEFYTDNGCQLCEPNFGFYSVEYDVVKCSIFDVNKLDNITSNQLQLKIGYWRPNYFSNVIDYCFKGLKYCIGGWKVNNELCYQGHIGGLCEECDQFNIRGDGNYVKISNGACGNCSKDSTLLPFFFLFLWSFLSILFTLRSIRKTNKTFVILKSTTQLFQILFKLTQDFQSIFLKMLLNYLWLFSVIFAFNISFNFSLSTVDSISSPNVTMATNLDCELITYGTLSLIYLRIITIIVLLLLQIFMILIGFRIFFFVQKTKFDYSVISNLLIYLYVSNQAQLIKSFGSLLAIRTISGIDFIQGDVSLLFYDKDHINWIYAFILPCLIITGLFIPLFFLTILILNKNQFTQTNFRKHFGYLFNEYNQEFSYWEQIKILQRSIIIIIITYFETDIQIKAALMSLTLIAYIIFAVTIKPYIIKSLNKLDFESCCIVQLSIFLSIVEYNCQQSNYIFLSMILQIIMLLLCLRISYCFISRIISLYYQKYQLQVFFHLKNFTQKLLRNSIFVIYLNQQYARILVRKQKLNIHYQKLREWKNQQYTQPVYYKKQTNLTGFANLSITKDKNHSMKSLVPRVLIK